MSNKIIKLTKIMFLLIFFVTPLKAFEFEEDKTNFYTGFKFEEDKTNFYNKFTASITHYRYIEPDLMKLIMNGIEIGLSNLTLFSNGAIISPEFTIGFSEGRYYGSYINIKTLETKPAEFGGEKDSYMYTSFNFGGGTTINNFTVMGLSGLGYRFLKNTAEAPGTYDRHQTYVYVPFKFMASWSFNNFSVVLGQGVNYIVYALHKSFMQKFRYDKDVLIFKGQKGLGNDTFLAFNFYEKLNVTFAYRNWYISDSDIVEVNIGNNIRRNFLEPKNETHQFVISLGSNF